ncbi:MFS transporter [Lichenicoccus sp.]|uniref:MFS transporter n=1 Tax=Lichenicoccus sp. TaxID=2781899 RepID=UPI003D111483
MNQPGGTVRTTVPARLDRLPWSRFHMLVVVALGITWILDGLEVTIVGSLGPVLQQHNTLALTPANVGSAASLYVVGAVVGALVFGWLTDKVGRKAIFSLTLGVYIAGVLLSACSWNFVSFALFRFITGLGIGGEYSAINSAIDELIPARLRGRVDLIVNGSFWAGAALGAGGSIFLVGGDILPVGLGWRFGFAIGGVLGLIVIVLRRWVPESPRWLCTHGRVAEGERITDEIEQRVCRNGLRLSDVHETMLVHTRERFGFRAVLRQMLGAYRSRSVLALVLMIAQAFLYNAVFFTYGLVLVRYEHVPGGDVGLFILPLAISNFIGPLLLGPLFDTIGRRRMIFASYGIAGILMLLVAALFAAHRLDALTQTLGWVAVFFFASAASSSAYLTASEVFPLEIRALAIALFYAIGTVIGGAAAPWLFGELIEVGGAGPLALGYVGAAVLMLIAAIVALVLGVDAEGKSLESIAPPLSSL